MGEALILELESLTVVYRKATQSPTKILNFELQNKLSNFVEFKLVAILLGMGEYEAT